MKMNECIIEFRPNRTKVKHVGINIQLCSLRKSCLYLHKFYVIICQMHHLHVHVKFCLNHVRIIENKEREFLLLIWVKYGSH